MTAFKIKENTYMFFCLLSKNCPFEQIKPVVIAYPDHIHSRGDTPYEELLIVENMTQITALLFFPRYTAIIYGQGHKDLNFNAKVNTWSNYFCWSSFTYRIISNNTVKLVRQAGNYNWINFEIQLQNLFLDYRYNGGKPLCFQECLDVFNNIQKESAWLSSIRLKQCNGT